MKKPLTALATITLLFSATAYAESKTYSVDSFSKIDVDGAMNVIHKTGPETSVVVETSSGDFSDAIVETNGDELRISRESLDAERSWFSWGGRSVSVSEDGKVVKVNGKKRPYYTVRVTSPQLGAIEVSQSSRFESQTINAGEFEARASSSARVTLAGTAGDADLSASSSGELNAGNLKAETLNASASSSGELKATVTGTGETRANASSSGEVTLKSLKAAEFIVGASSSASVELSGACGRISVNASSGAEVDADDLRCTSANANASSGADVELYATDSATAKASSGADISFSGKPVQQEASKSSGGSISFN